MDSLRLWRLWMLKLPLVDGHDAVVKWAFAAQPTHYPGYPILLPYNSPALCATAELWFPLPRQMTLPLDCLAIRTEEWEAALQLPRHPLTQLDQLIAPTLPDGNGSRSEQTGEWVRTVALATLVEYAATTYGADSIPMLVAGLSHATSWESLFSSSYGVSAAEFEADWQTYVSAHTKED
ncbi:MAG: hypothetical protein R3C14_30335 [Caldilineaceae bacterium]